MSTFRGRRGQHQSEKHDHSCGYCDRRRDNGTLRVYKSPRSSRNRLWTGSDTVAILRGPEKTFLPDCLSLTHCRAFYLPMPNTASAKKRLRQNEKKRLHNRSEKSKMRTQIRKLRDAVKAGDTDQVQSDYRAAQKSIDKAASKNLIHRNAAARTKSRLSKLVKTLS